MRIRSVELRFYPWCVRVMRVDCMCRPVRVTERTPQQNRVEVCVHEPYNLVFNSLLFLSCEKVKKKKSRTHRHQTHPTRWRRRSRSLWRRIGGRRRATAIMAHDRWLLIAIPHRPRQHGRQIRRGRGGGRLLSQPTPAACAMAAAIRYTARISIRARSAQGLRAGRPSEPDRRQANVATQSRRLLRRRSSSSAIAQAIRRAAAAIAHGGLAPAACRA